MTDRPLSEDPVVKHLREQDKFYRENPRDDTRGTSFRERWETMEPVTE